MLKKLIYIGLLIVSVFSVSSFTQQKTEISSSQAKAMLIGRHQLSLQWISWDYFGTAAVTERGGAFWLKGKHTSRQNGDYLILHRFGRFKRI